MKVWQAGMRARGMTMGKRGPLELSPTAVYLGAVVRQLEQERDQWRDEAQQAQAQCARLVEAARAAITDSEPVEEGVIYDPAAWVVVPRASMEALEAAVAEGAQEEEG